jgi:DNA modification methylase
VLDPFMGSGTSAVAAAMHRRRFIGFELNPEYFRIVEKRVADARKGESGGSRKRHKGSAGKPSLPDLFEQAESV